MTIRIRYIVLVVVLGGMIAIMAGCGGHDGGPTTNTSNEIWRLRVYSGGQLIETKYFEKKPRFKRWAQPYLELDEYCVMADLIIDKIDRSSITTEL